MPSSGWLSQGPEDGEGAPLLSLALELQTTPGPHLAGVVERAVEWLDSRKILLEARGAGGEVFVALAGGFVLEVLAQIAERASLLDGTTIGGDLLYEQLLERRPARRDGVG